MYETELIFDYAKEPSRDILCIDCKSFYASVECVRRGLHPLETKLVVMSYPSADPKERGSGLILASSPAAKKAYGISNISRARDLPFPYPPGLVIAAPQMRLYMQKNTEINNIYKKYADEDNHHVYSVDESFVDITGTQKLFGKNSAYEMAKLIQADVLQTTGIYTTIGIGDNPLLAKLALDNAAKHQPDMIAEWRYPDIPDTVWKIPDMTDFWGIGKRTQLRLNQLGISSIHDLAHTNYYYLKSKLGVIGAQLYAHSWGIDRSFLGEKVKVSSKSIGNSQVLNKDYVVRSEIEIVLIEMADQVATRLRKSGAKTQLVSLSIGYSINYIDQLGRTGFHQQLKIPPTNASSELVTHILMIFDQHYKDQSIRNVGVGAGNLIYTDFLQLDLFQEPDEQVNEQKKDLIVDSIRKKYGFRSLVRAVSLLEGGRAIARSSLVGGHAGGMAGLEEGEENAERTKKRTDKVFEDYNDYHDRGMIKWVTAYAMDELVKSISAGKAEAVKDIPILPQMSPAEIDETLAEAFKKNRRLSVQLNQKDRFGRQTESIEGFFKGYCGEDEILIGEAWVPLELIRNVHILHKEKWSRVAVFRQNQD